MAIEALDHRTTDYRLSHAYWLARASDLAYKDRAAIETAASDWGFDRVRHFESRHALPFPLEDTQAYTMAGDHMIITAFRGTEPDKIYDWLTDGSAPPTPGPGNKGFVHDGFHQALMSVYPEVRDTLAEFRTGGQSVWFTGHSLGGALAMLAGNRLYFEEPRILPDGIYTFGQPRTCDHLLAVAHNSAIAHRTYRFVNNNDIVPQVPPAPAFAHVDAARYFDAQGALHDSVPFTRALTDKVRGYTADMFAPASDGVRDHLLRHYLTNLETNLA